MATEIGLPRIKPDELRVRAMAHHQDNVAAMAERERRFREEHVRAQLDRAAKTLRDVLHLEPDPIAVSTKGDTADSERRDVYATIDGIVFRVVVDDEVTHPSVYAVLPCDWRPVGDWPNGHPDQHESHDWLVNGPSRLGELLTDPPTHADAVALEARVGSRALAADGVDHAHVTPEQNLVDAIRLVIRNEIDGE